MQTLRQFDKLASKSVLKKQWKELKKKAYTLCEQSNSLRKEKNLTILDNYESLKKDFDNLLLQFRNQCMCNGMYCPHFDHYDICRIAD
jgi:translation initiation factor 1 (eIF-1/SUI1)